MKKGLYLVFRCQMCGTLFEEKYDHPKDYSGNRMAPEEFVGHIGAHSSWIVSTHNCTPDSGSNPDTYGCGQLVGARIYKGADKEDGDDAGGGS